MIFSCGTYQFWLWRESKEEMKHGKLSVAGQNESGCHTVMVQEWGPWIKYAIETSEQDAGELIWMP